MMQNDGDGLKNYRTQPIQPDPTAVLRKLLWLRHGCGVGALYGDDGEMSCNKCMIDFKRWSPETIASTLRIIAVQSYQYHADSMTKQRLDAPPGQPAAPSAPPAHPAVLGNRADCYYCGYACPIDPDNRGWHKCLFHGFVRCEDIQRHLKDGEAAIKIEDLSDHVLLQVIQPTKSVHYVLKKGDQVVITG